MIYKIGDKVTVKSFKWYLDNKDNDGAVINVPFVFVTEMSEYCGKNAIIISRRLESKTHAIEKNREQVFIYSINIDIDNFSWSDEMFESIKDERKAKLKKITNESNLARAIDSEQLKSITNGKTYSVLLETQLFYQIMNNNNRKTEYFKNRFIPVKEQRKLKLKKISNEPNL